MDQSETKQGDSLRPTIRSITEADLPTYHAFRLAGLRAHPEAFGETAEHFMTVTPAQIASRLKSSEARGGFILGAFSEGTLLGVVGLARQEGEKMEHRATIWGMYVAPSARGLGVGRDLMGACLMRARQIPKLRQVHLCVVTSNQPAINLYRSFGFSSYGTDPAALKIGEQLFDEELMVTVL
jgi:ribosomal protein S18 acetylase RimI-like enzyme